MINNNITKILKTQASILSKDYSQFQAITKSTIKSLEQDRQIPCTTMAVLFERLSSSLVETSNAEFILIFNMMRCLAIVNFNNLADNQMNTLMCMIYAQKISSLSQQITEQNIEIALILNQILLKLVQRTRQTIPEYYAWVSKTLEFLHKQVKQSGTITINSSFSSQSTLAQQILTLLNRQDAEFGDFVPLIVRQLGNFTEVFKRDQFLGLQEMTKIKQLLKDMVQLTGKQNKQLSAIINQSLYKEQKEDTAVYLDEPEYFKELTPRIITEEPSMKLKLLKKKKNKLQKKINSDLKSRLRERLQQEKVISDVKREKVMRQQKKEIFILQKQTEEAKKYHKQMKKVKMIKKKGKK